MRRSILSCLLPSRVLAACSAPPARDGATAAPSALPPVQHPADNLNTRHTPSLYNVGCQTARYGDGRATTLEGQVSAAWRAQIGADPAKVAALLNGVPVYRSRFEAVFGSEATPQNVAQAVSAAAVEGQALFAGKGRCVACHAPPFYGYSTFFTIGLEHGKAELDKIVALLQSLTSTEPWQAPSLP